MAGLRLEAARAVWTADRPWAQRPWRKSSHALDRPPPPMPTSWSTASSREAVAASIPLNQINARLVHRVVTLLRHQVVFMKLERRKNPAGSGGRTLLESLRSSTVGGGYSVVRCSVPRRRLRSGRPAERIAGTCSKLHSAILSILLRAVRIQMDSTCSAIHGRLSARNAGEHEAGAHRRRNPGTRTDSSST